jgi:hypothetical protein
MPIKRLQRTEGQPQFPNIGKLRKGGERPESGKAPGKDLDYFRFTSDDDRAMAMFEAAYGKEPQAINVYLPMPTTDENFSSWQEAWVAGGLQHRCDGETCTIWLKPDGTYSQEPKPCPGGCKEVGRLMVIIPELQRMAYVTAETHSINDIITLTDNLNAIESIAGTLTGIPFILKRVAKEISTPAGNGKRARRTKWMLSIEVDPVWAALLFDTMHRQALNAVSGNAPMLVDNLDPEFEYANEIDEEYKTLSVSYDDGGQGAYSNSGLEPGDFPESLTDAPEDSAAHLATSAGDDNPFDDASPAFDAESIIKAWKGPVDAQNWIVAHGLATNDHSARNAFKEAVKACGGYSADNKLEVFAVYLNERVAKHGQPAA